MPAFIHHHEIEMAPVICPGCVGLLPMYVRDVEPHWSMAKIDFIYECCGLRRRSAAHRAQADSLTSACMLERARTTLYRPRSARGACSDRKPTTGQLSAEAGPTRQTIAVIGAPEIAFPEVISDLVERALFPLFGLRQPKHPALGIQRGTLSAHIFLTAYLRELVHEPHSCGVKSITAMSVAEVARAVSRYCAKARGILRLRDQHSRSATCRSSCWHFA